MKTKWMILATLSALSIATAAETGPAKLADPGFEQSAIGSIPAGWTKIEQPNLPPHFPTVAAGVRAELDGTVAMAGERFLAIGRGTACALQVVPAMQAKIQYYVQAEALPRRGGGGRLYFASTLEPRSEPAETILPALDDPARASGMRWNTLQTKHSPTAEEVGQPLYLVLEMKGHSAPDSFTAWDEMFFRQIPLAAAQAAQRANWTVPRDAASGQIILKGLQAFLDELEPVPGNEAAIAQAHVQMGTAADRGLGDWDLAERHYAEAARLFEGLRKRYPDVWRYPNSLIWVENERFWKNWRTGKLGVCKQILDRCRPVRKQLMAAIRHDQPGMEYQTMLRTRDYGKWNVDRMEANFHEIAGRSDEEFALLDGILAEAEVAIALGEGNRNQHTWTCGLASSLCVEQGKFREALAYAERMKPNENIREPLSAIAEASGILIYSEARMSVEGPSDELWQEARRAYLSATNDLISVRSYGWLHLAAGDYAAALELLDQAVDIGHRQDMRQFLRKTLRYRAEAKLGLGLVAEAAEDLVDALAISRELADKTVEVPLYQLYGRCARLIGSPNQAFEPWNIALDLAIKLNMPYRALDILLDIAELQADLGLTDELARTWRRIEDLIETRPGIAEIWIARADKLRPGHRERIAQAKPARQSEKRTAVDARLVPAADPEVPEAAVPAPVAAGATPPENIYLQPAIIQTRLIPGEMPAAQFILLNVSPAESRGTVTAHAAGLACDASQEEGQWIFRLREAEQSGSEEGRAALAIAPGEALALVLVTEDSASESPDREVVLTWKGQRSAEAVWRFGPHRMSTFSTIADASVLHENPFYVIPFRHSLRTASQAPGATDLSVAATRPCRIEYYDVDAQRLLAIDATGDGLFDGRGDALHADDNQSGYPDVPLDDLAALRQIELWVYPATEGVQPGDETELTLRVRRQNEWHAEAVDILIHTDTGTPQDPRGSLASPAAIH